MILCQLVEVLYCVPPVKSAISISDLAASDAALRLRIIPFGSEASDTGRPLAVGTAESQRSVLWHESLE